jgi:hypothetical protein
MPKNLERTLLAGVLTLSVSATAAVVVQQPHGVHVCIAPDRTIRYEPSTQCAGGQASYQLVEVRDLAGLQGAPASRSESDQVKELQARLDAAQRRLASLEAFVADVNTRGGGHRVTVPFEVDDEKGQPIFAVRSNPRGFSLFAPGGQSVAAGTALGDGAFFKVFNISGTREAVMGAVGSVSLLDVRQSRDKSGVKLAVAEDNAPTMLIFNQNNISVAALTRGNGGAGRLQLTNPAGTPTVDAGTLGSGAGQVDVGPNSSCPVAGGLRVPTCIRGRVGSK